MAEEGVVEAPEDGFSDSELEGDMVEMLEKETAGRETAGQVVVGRAEKNRLKAVALKRARLEARPYSAAGGEGGRGAKKEKKLVDGGGGFFVEEDEAEAEAGRARVVTAAPPPLLPPDQPECRECGLRFAESYLLRLFDHEVCDDCRNTEKDGPHQLITKTDAKKEFLLKDADFEKGERDEPFEPLGFVLRKNPHNPRWGDMKLFLRQQVEERALQVWGSEEAVEREQEAREERQVAAKGKKYEKKMKELRKAARSSLFTKDLSAHVHNYGAETFHEDRDEYSRECSGCGQLQTYEKM
jgi:DNA-repair protein complementing XP-A cells